MYKIILEGIAEGQDRDEVISRLATLFNLSVKRTTKFLDMPNFVVKIHQDREIIEEFKSRLEAAGAICRIEAHAISSQIEAAAVAPEPEPDSPDKGRLYYVVEEQESSGEPVAPYEAHPKVTGKKISDLGLRLMVHLVVALLIIGLGVTAIFVGKESQDASKREALEKTRQPEILSRAGSLTEESFKPQALEAKPDKPKRVLTPMVYQCSRSDGTVKMIAFLASGYYVESLWLPGPGQKVAGDTVFGIYHPTGNQYTLSAIGLRRAKAAAPGEDPSPWRSQDIVWRTVEFQMSGNTGRATLLAVQANGNDLMKPEEPESCEIPAAGNPLETASKFFGTIPRAMLPTAELSSLSTAQEAAGQSGSRDLPVTLSVGKDGGGTTSYIGVVEQGHPVHFRLLGTGYGRIAEVKVYSPAGNVTVQVKNNRRSFKPALSRDFVPSEVDYVLVVGTEASSAPYRLVVAEREDTHARSLAEAAIQKLEARYEELGRRCPPMANQSFGVRYVTPVSSYNSGESSLKQLGRYHLTTLTHFENARSYAEEAMDKLDEEFVKAEQVCRQEIGGVPKTGGRRP